MSYLYFPGCSLKGTGRAYEDSMLAVFQLLETALEELEDWNCCGATAYMAISELKAFALSARNLALAEAKKGSADSIDLIAPCAACYLVLNKTNKYFQDYPDIRKKINSALDAATLSYKGTVKVRHPLDIIVNDIGMERISKMVKKPLKGLKVACYYGCQIVRPYADFDDQHNPSSMNVLMKTLGAETLEWPLKTRCCGGSLTGTVQETGMRLSYVILKEAEKRGADVIATACPLCQFNLECYQKQMGSEYHDKVKMPVAYFSQLMGLAFGMEDSKLGINRLFVPIKSSQFAGGAYVRG
ncbi:Heterodisulfide reductase subunit B [Candidatus Zixiibacteriota bacterium]|nr:Heterodisulfide reductase subunit B [candidate division Zixibacteria bacterium]